MYNGAILSEEVPIEKFDKPHQSKSFTPIIAHVFYKAVLIENGGRGTTNIISDCVAYGLPKPTFEYEWTAVRVTFYKVKLNVGTNKLLEFIRSNQPVRVSHMKNILIK